MRGMWVFVRSDIARASTARGDERMDLGLMLGSTNATDASTALRFDRGLTYQATFAWRVWSSDDRVSLSIEVPFLASPAFGVMTADGSLPKEYASLYLTPGVRLTLPVRGPLSAFGAVGGGYARYSESKLRGDGSANPAQQDTNTGALQYGGGINMRAWRWIGFRGEIRDVYTGARRFSMPTAGTAVHNVVVSGGLELRF